MGLGKERFFSSQRSPEHLAPLPQNGVFYRENIPIPNSQEQRRLGEVRIKLKEQGKKEFREAFNRLVGNNGFEPFTNPSNDGEDQFVNNYTGNFWENMMLNREETERVLEIAHLDGQVFLSARGSLPKSSIELNPDGSVTAKRTLSIEQKIEEEEGENPLYRVKPIPQGWKIEINDKRIMELLERRLSGKELQAKFISNFNKLVNQGIFEAVRREKLSGEKDKYFKAKAFVGLLPIFIQVVARTPSLINHPFFATLFGVGYAIGLYGLFNSLSELTINRKIKNLSLGRFPLVRPNFDSFWEYFMPPVEIDKVIRAFAFLKGKGRNLVKERIEEEF